MGKKEKSKIINLPPTKVSQTTTQRRANPIMLRQGSKKRRKDSKCRKDRYPELDNVSEASAPSLEEALVEYMDKASFIQSSSSSTVPGYSGTAGSSRLHCYSYDSDSVPPSPTSHETGLFPSSSGGRVRKKKIKNQQHQATKLLQNPQQAQLIYPVIPSIDLSSDSDTGIITCDEARDGDDELSDAAPLGSPIATGDSLDSSSSPFVTPNTLKRPAEAQLPGILAAAMKNGGQQKDVPFLPSPMDMESSQEPMMSAVKKVRLVTEEDEGSQEEMAFEAPPVSCIRIEISGPEAPTTQHQPKGGGSSSN